MSHVGVWFYFLKLQKQFPAYFLPLSFIPNSPADFQNRFCKMCCFVAYTDT